jgi:hypothetical protein
MIYYRYIRSFSIIKTLTVTMVRGSGGDSKSDTPSFNTRLKTKKWCETFDSPTVFVCVSYVMYLFNLCWIYVLFFWFRDSFLEFISLFIFIIKLINITKLNMIHGPIILLKYFDFTKFFLFSFFFIGLSN